MHAYMHAVTKIIAKGMISTKETRMIKIRTAATSVVPAVIVPAAAVVAVEYS